MSWAKIVTFVVAIALVAGGTIWAYRIFEAPEHIDVITAKWETAGHADASSRSFTNWDGNDPPEIPVACAKCHSQYGYHDWLGVDGSALREVNTAAKTGSVLFCNTCHNNVGHTLTSVVFPGGAEVFDLGREANCMRCHQGRHSTVSVNAAIGDAADDAVTEGLGFLNVHYAVGAGTLMGNSVAVGYQYDGKDYVGRFLHTPDYDTCIDCHDPHSTRIDPAKCAPCHSNVVTYVDMFNVRESTIDYDGDGDTTTGIRAEIMALHGELYTAIQAYAADVIGTPIVYTTNFPYWATADGDRYASWTPRLVRTTYIYHYVLEDPGGFTHNASYLLQMLYDALEDLSETVPVEMAAYTRP
jgi:hypothetical protein